MNKPPITKSADRFWNWSENANCRELYLYGTIAEQSWFDDDVTPQMFREELMSGKGDIAVWLNSYGGDCIAASQIYSMLMSYPYDVTVKIDGIAASAASVVAMAGNRVLMSPAACLMIHDPMTAAVGNTADMEKAIAKLRSVKESIIDAYEIKTGLDRKALARLMTEETWMDCHKAMELGFADGILERAENPVRDYGTPGIFSRRSADMMLINKLRKFDDVLRKSTDVLEKDFVPVKPLYNRLNRLKS